MRGTAVRGVLLDVDDTLVDTRAGFAAAIEAVVEVYLPHLPAERRPEVLAMWRADAGGHYRAYTRGEIGFEVQRMRRANELHAAFGGAELDDAAYEAWRALFWGTFERSWVAHDDAVAAVRALVDAGVPVGAVTNAATALQERKLAATGLGDLVPVLASVDTFGVGKPDARIFHEGARRLGVEPGHAAYVGDELDVDARGARDAGLLGVWLDRPGARRGGPHPEDPDEARASGVRVIGSLAELPDLFAPR
ncbi:HAD family hydrolase [Cellulomonas sp. PhB143]|uniref:HAD family hydrolase n=1 Tax=Cellulomonas sp. PhB143 TaxID=2485186 RepID=UPI000FBF0EE7|nr:HAD family hydrolase [Cellulomonas sp. PhB143]ROS73545.1 putative hydrolase of the HAD superfamily [Cellulomonas sp. PhB143]